MIEKIRPIVPISPSKRTGEDPRAFEHTDQKPEEKCEYDRSVEISFNKLPPRQPRPHNGIDRLA
jgi:hypothetical protein